MIKAVAWDIDGTLVDSEPLHLKSLLMVCKNYNVDISDLPDEHFLGVSLHGVWKVLSQRFPASVNFSEWTGQINEFYSAHSSTLTVIPHASEVIHRLYISGIKQVAVSNSNRSIVDINLAAIGASNLMSFSLSLDDVERGKPDPFPYKLVTKKLGLKPHEILAVEDSNSGITSAVLAGLPTAAINVKEILDTVPEFAINSLSEVILIIEKGRLVDKDSRSYFANHGSGGGT